jgi:hypothetical protein
MELISWIVGAKAPSAASPIGAILFPPDQMMIVVIETMKHSFAA